MNSVYSQTSLKEYTIATILAVHNKHVPYYAGTFESTADTDLSWPHRHTFYSLVWFTHGHGFYIIDEVEYQIIPQRLFMVEPQQVHNWDYAEDSRGFVLLFDQSIALELNIHFPSPFMDIESTARPLHMALLTNLVAEQAHADRLSATIVTAGLSYYYQLLLRLAAKGSLPRKKVDPMLTDFKAILACTPIGKYNAAYYAAKMNVSLQKLNSVCRKAIGFSAKQYLLRLRLTEAKRLMIYSKLNVNQIADKLNFEDSSYFSRIFKKNAGLSPSNFIKKYRK